MLYEVGMLIALEYLIDRLKYLINSRDSHGEKKGGEWFGKLAKANRSVLDGDIFHIFEEELKKCAQCL